MTIPLFKKQQRIVCHCSVNSFSRPPWWYGEGSTTPVLARVWVREKGTKNSSLATHSSPLCQLLSGACSSSWGGGTPGTERPSFPVSIWTNKSIASGEMASSKSKNFAGIHRGYQCCLSEAEQNVKASWALIKDAGELKKDHVPRGASLCIP